MPVTDWRAFDYGNKLATRPPDDQLVWIIEQDYAEAWITVGYFDGFTFRVWYGSDDCFVSHWAFIVYPQAPDEDD